MAHASELDPISQSAVEEPTPSSGGIDKAPEIPNAQPEVAAEPAIGDNAVTDSHETVPELPTPDTRLDQEARLEEVSCCA